MARVFNQPLNVVGVTSSLCLCVRPSVSSTVDTNRTRSATANERLWLDHLFLDVMQMPRAEMESLESSLRAVTSAAASGEKKI